MPSAPSPRPPAVLLVPMAVACLSVMLLVPAGPAFADRIIMRNGLEVEGEVFRETEERVWIRVRGGEIILERKYIRQVIRKEPPEIPVAAARDDADDAADGEDGAEAGAENDGGDADAAAADGDDGSRAVVPTNLAEAIENLFSDDPDTAMHATDLLRASGAPAARALVQAYEDTQDHRRRMTIVTLLGDVGRPEASDLLLRILGDESAAALMRTEAAGSLERIEDPATVEPMARFIGHPAPRVAMSARRLLTKLHESGAVDIVPILREVLAKGPGDGNRAMAASMLGSLDDTDSINRLMDLVDDRHPYVRGEAAHALGRMTLGQRRDAVWSRLARQWEEEDNDVVRRRLAGAMSRLAEDDPDELDILVDALALPDPEVRKRAAEALRRLSGEDFGRSYTQWRAWYRRTFER